MAHREREILEYGFPKSFVGVGVLLHQVYKATIDIGLYNIGLLQVITTGKPSYLASYITGL